VKAVHGLKIALQVIGGIVAVLLLFALVGWAYQAVQVIVALSVVRGVIWLASSSRAELVPTKTKKISERSVRKAVERLESNLQTTDSTAPPASEEAQNRA